MRKAFISYHHADDQDFKDALSIFGEMHGCFEDCSVQVGDIDDDDRSSQRIREIIRDEYLRDTEVTILLCGAETRGRKHVDWELKSSMIDGKLNSRSGVLVVNLPTANSSAWTAALPGEKEHIYPDHFGEWMSVNSETAYRERYPRMPARIIDNLLSPKALISVVQWDYVYGNAPALKWLIEMTAQVGPKNEYDLSRKMRRQNSSKGFY